MEQQAYTYTNRAKLMADLPEKVVEHSKRVAAYTQALFLEACVNDIYSDDPRAQTRLMEEYKDMAYDMGLFHDCGKVLIPEIYHEAKSTFSPEERAMYRKHSRDSAGIATAVLLAEDKYTKKQIQFMADGIMSHHETWTGKGFPDKLAGRSIPFMARIIAMADTIDAMTIGLISEHPFDDVMKLICGSNSGLDDPETIRLVRLAKPRLKKVFNSFIGQTKTVAPTPMLFRHNSTRPFFLMYRPVVERKLNRPIAYEASMKFRGKEGPREYEEFAELIRREKLAAEMGAYFIVEACDTLRRMDACHIAAQFIIMDLPDGWLNRRGAWRDVVDALTDSGVEAPRICIDVDARLWESRTKTTMDNLLRIRQLGCGVMFTGIDPEEISEEDKIFNYYRLTQELDPYLEDEDKTDVLSNMCADGIRLISNDLDRKKYQPLLTRNGIFWSTGEAWGDYESENDVIEKELALQNAV